MKNNSGWLKYTTLTTSLLLTATAFTTPAFAVNTSQVQGIHSHTSKDTYQLAQASNSTCRRVVSGSGIYVRQGPTVYSPALGAIGYGRNVSVESEAQQGWVRISAPLPGYVYAGFLGSCEAAAPPPPTNCRRVVASTGLPVRQEPSSSAASLGVVAPSRRVTIDNLGSDGWVPITVPLKGYVQANYLAYCR